VLDLCKFGDTVIMQKCSTIYQKKVKGKTIEKGVAFPTCPRGHTRVLSFKKFTVVVYR